MYYNKLEALREKEVAEKMIAIKDYVSARAQLVKAQNRFPALDHIVSMLTVCDILSASGNKIPGYDTDYYWVLQLMPSCTPSDLECRYQKLVTLLQPIKNKFTGTELAVKLIQDAFSVLSDIDKRSAFDLKRGLSWADYETFVAEASFCHRLSAEETGISAQIPSACDKVSSGQFLEESNEVGLSTDMQPDRIKNLGPKLVANHNGDKQLDNISFQPSSSSTDVNSEGNTGEDRDTHVDDINSPTDDHSSLKGNTSWSSKAVEQKKLDQDFYNFENNRTAECFKTGQIWAVHHHLDEPHNYRYAQINTTSKSAVGVTWLKPVPISEDERRWCDAGLPVACGSFCLDLEMIEKVSGPMVFSYSCSWVPGVTEEQFEIYPKKGEVWALYEDWDPDEWSYNPEIVKGCKFKFVEILSDFSKYLGAEGACLVKVDGFRSVFRRQTEEEGPIILHISPSNFYMLSHNVPAYKFTGGEIDGIFSGMFELDQLALLDNMIHNMDSQMMPKEENANSFNLGRPVERYPPFKSNSDSTVLGPYWSLNDFAPGQVWAVHCGKDLMPRQYARINSVISGSQVCVTILEPQPVLDYEVNWKKENLPIVCGVFRVDETTVNLEISQLSHPVKCQQSTTRPIYKIYPMKGEIWAMYQNWDSEWKHSDFENHECWVVEILSDFSEGEKTMIAKLGEVKGCLTFFQRQRRDGFDLARAVSKTEMLSFSHQIPAFRVPGIGRHGIPESSWHLEPNALPLNDGK